ncbi:MAG: malto-oligosyltrehalose trehalohydrolase [Burkholderiales bacterium]|nr:malto-oligosyltrehalose trehalohydrolase [Burkholderiales bacterium]
MPFGAEVRNDGATRFRLWAPGAERVDVALGDAASPDVRAMAAAGSGWFEALVREAPAGTRYRFRIDGKLSVPDPASRCNPDDVHGPSLVVDPLAFEWSDGAWRGRPWEDAIIYELHVGTFTPEGTFAAALAKLDYLAALGVTAVELMPVADFPGARNWGYDGVLPYAPDAAYGTPDDLKRLVQSAHRKGLMIFLDVVYNHFGPEGNYLHAYAAPFFNPRRRTPWGAAINFDADGARVVRDFFIHNALFWIEEYGVDGLRVDAVHAIADESRPDIVAELAEAIRARADGERHVHLVLENDRNQSRYLRRDSANRPVQATAQWNDDLHHALHVLLTGERDGYYADYSERPLWHLGRGLAEGFAYQGERSGYRDGKPRGEPSATLPPAAFVTFIQTHDQVGNRAYGERIGRIAEPRRLRAALACLLLAPAPPMLFMGEEFDASTPFLFFCDFGPELAAAVAHGRRAEFGRFARFRDPAVQATIPDPTDPTTFARSKLDWEELDRPPHAEWHALYRELLDLRHRHIVPRLAGMRAGGTFSVRDDAVLHVAWTLGDGARLHLLAALSDAPRGSVDLPPGSAIYPPDPGAQQRLRVAPPAPFAVFTLEDAA